MYNIRSIIYFTNFQETYIIIESLKDYKDLYTSFEDFNKLLSFPLQFLKGT